MTKEVKPARSKLIDIEELAEYLSGMSDESKIYIGGDSRKVFYEGAWHADFTCVVVVHKDGKHGCRVFGELTRERVYDPKQKPSMRLMTEVYKIAELHQKIQHLLTRFKVEVHLDLNAKKIYASNAVVAEAIGYIRGVCGIDPQIKPDAFSASYAADRLQEIWSYKMNPPTAANMISHRNKRHDHQRSSKAVH